MSKIAKRIDDAIKWHKDNFCMDIDIENPKLFCEKLIWLYKYFYTKNGEKLADWDKIYNKDTFKKYIQEKFGPGFTAKLYGVYKKPEEIDFSVLPNTFVLKSTRGGYGQQVKIIKDKKEEDVNKLRLLVSEWLKTSDSAKIIAEQYLDGAVRDYKFFMAGKNLMFIQAFYKNKADLNPFSKDTVLYDSNWNRVPFFYSCKNISELDIIAPKNIDLMLKLASQVGAEFPFIRIDFYESDNKVYFGEFTCFPSEGKIRFSPEEWNLKLGEYIKLPYIDT